ncbi:MAG: hypothetical protein QW052_05780 [Candidatus Nitrosocaldaceae archaeon]
MYTVDLEDDEDKEDREEEGGEGEEYNSRNFLSKSLNSSYVIRKRIRRNTLQVSNLCNGIFVFILVRWMVGRLRSKK